MEKINPIINLDSFFDSLAKAKKRVLMLDYDGTLAPFRVKRDEALPYEGVVAVLDAIMGTGQCRVVLISGRWTEDLVKLVRFAQQPEIWGSHGRERVMPDGSYHVEKIKKESLQALTAAEDWLKDEGLYDYCEMKPACIALHWRGLGPGAVEDLRDRVQAQWPRIQNNEELSLTEFDGGLEIRIPGKSKGDAVRKVMSACGPECAAAYLGDDQTDEDAFRALEGRGLRVLVRPRSRLSCADVWLQPPRELLAFLNRWLEACKGQ